MLNNGQDLADLRAPPGNRLARLRGDRKEQWSIRINPDTALRLARYFGTSERFWLGLQMDYELEETQREKGPRIQREVIPRAKAS